MSTALNQELGHLEDVYEAPHDDRCQAYSHSFYGEECWVAARWACYAGPTCSGVLDATRVLWCDVRYQRHLTRIAFGLGCICGKPESHWTVVPL